MAFNLLVELGPNVADWRSISDAMRSFSANGIECFPIQATGIEGNCLGLSFLGDNSSPDRIDAFIGSVLYLLNEGYRVFELYSSMQFSKENLTQLTEDFLS